MPLSVILWLAFTIAVTAFLSYLGIRRRQKYEERAVNQGAIRNVDGSLRFPERDVEIVRSVAFTGITTGAGDVPIHCVTNSVEVKGACPSVAFVRISARKSSWFEMPEKQRLERQFGTPAGGFRLEAMVSPGYVGFMESAQDATVAPKLAAACLEALRQGIWRTFTGWPVFWIDVLPGPARCTLGFHSLDTLSALHRRSRIADLNRRTVLAARAIRAEFG
ncbi:MAG: hypothetical protein ABSH47_03625 [Bryobacteraceae bacterium]|jgi:hypothetical protein